MMTRSVLLGDHGNLEYSLTRSSGQLAVNQLKMVVFTWSYTFEIMTLFSYNLYATTSLVDKSDVGSINRCLHVRDTDNKLLE